MVQRVQLPDTLEAVNEYFHRRRMTDGLPIVPPTEDRVARMAAASGRDAADVVATVPPTWEPATIEKIAVNAVMAGCAPEYMPVVVAGVDAMCEPEFNLYAIQTTTNAVSPIFVVNGPIRHQLKINCAAGVLGPGWQANATIGRALRLVMINVGGALPSDIDKATLGWPGKYTCCIGEFEEASPWEPLHVERGFKREDNTITAYACDGVMPMTDVSAVPEYMLDAVVQGMKRFSRVPLILNKKKPYAPMVLLLNPVFAKAFSGMGFTKQSFRQYLFEKVVLPKDWFLPEREDNAPVTGDVRLAEFPELYQIVVTGSEAGFHCASMGTNHTGGKPVTKLIHPAA